MIGGRRHRYVGMLAPLVMVAASGCSPQRDSFQVLQSTTTSFRGLMYLPPNYAQATEPFPMILFLHGAGERGGDLNALRRQGLPRELAAGRLPGFPCVVVCPQCPEDRWWSPHELVRLVDEVIAGSKVDPDRVYVTGLSMGGYGTWSLITTAPDRFAAAVPICGGGNPDRAERLTRLPVWAFHGDLDPVVPVRESVTMVQRMLDAGGDVKLTIYSFTGHDAWTRTYRNPAVYDWLLAHRRGGNGHDVSPVSNPEG